MAPKDQGQASPQDSYEAAYMKGAGKLLRRERTVWSMHWLLLIPMPLLAIITGVILTGAGSKPTPPAVALLPVAMSGLMALLWLTFRVLRVHVTEQEVHIQYGIFGPKIPVKAIESCRVVEYDFARYGGWGIRYGLDGSWAYSLAGDSDRVVEITWREGGKTRKVVVSSLEPEALAASIQQAQAAASPRLRAPGEAAPAAVEGARGDDEALAAEVAAAEESAQGQGQGRAAPRGLAGRRWPAGAGGLMLAPGTRRSPPGTPA